MKKVRDVGSKILIFALAGMCSFMLSPGHVANAADKGEVKAGEKTELTVDDTVTLICSSNYAYNGREVEWNCSEDGVVEIVETDDGNSYSSITKAQIKAIAPGDVTVTMHAEDFWGWYKDDESFEIKVAGNEQATESPEQSAESTNGTADEKDKSAETQQSQNTAEPANSENKSEQDVPKAGNATEAKDIEESKEQSTNGKENGESVKKNLFIRLVGAFESKMVGEEEYDAISSATTVSYIPEQSNSVKLQAALSEKKNAEEVEDGSWHELSFFNQEDGAIKVNEDPTKTKIVVEPECEGITANYNIFTGDVILSGTPKKEGTYKIYVVFTDTEGRTATSNAVEFKVNSQHEKLSERLNIKNCTQTADGKYIFDQDPWYIEEFGEDTVVVPKEIKAWFGSHTLGTYSEIGEIISLTGGDEPKQTLIIPDGCNLTMVNVRVHSGVKIVVQKGGKFSIRQSTLEGIVEVENGGSFSCDYVDYGADAGFIYGSTINGQIRLKEGATIENSRIISKTNYSARDDINRKNQNPVVVVDGNVNVKGDVYILADEAPNGSYGQTGLSVNGTLNIPSGSTVAVYGGGSSHLTAKGGDAIVLNGGLIQGSGNIIAIGGFGMNITGDRSLLGGGAAISGDGSLDVKNIYVEGGSSFDTLVKPVQGKVLVSTRSDVTAVYGKVDGSTSENYWHGTGDSNIVPVVKKYFDEAKLVVSEEKSEGKDDAKASKEEKAADSEKSDGNNAAQSGTAANAEKSTNVNSAVNNTNAQSVTKETTDKAKEQSDKAKSTTDKKTSSDKAKSTNDKGKKTEDKSKSSTDKNKTSSDTSKKDSSTTKTTDSTSGAKDITAKATATPATATAVNKASSATPVKTESTDKKKSSTGKTSGSNKSDSDAKKNANGNAGNQPEVLGESRKNTDSKDDAVSNEGVKDNSETEQLVASADSSINEVSEPEEQVEDSSDETLDESKPKPGVGTFIVACVGILSTLTGCGIFTIKKLRA